MPYTYGSDCPGMVAATAKPLPGSKTPGVTRTYTRVEAGRPQRVNQYQNHKIPAPRASASTKPGKAAGDYKTKPTTRTAWRDITAGDVLDFGGEPWRVQETYIGGPSSGKSAKNTAGKPNTKGTRNPGTKASSGKGVNTGGKNISTGSQGKGVNTGKKLSTTPVTNLLENLWTGKRVQITLHPSFMVWLYS